MGKNKQSQRGPSIPKQTLTHAKATAASRSAASSVSAPSKSTSSSSAALASSASAFLNPLALASLLGCSILLFGLILLGEAALSQALLVLFEVVLGSKVRDLNHAVSQLESPLLLHLSVLLFQLTLVCILAFIVAYGCFSFLLSSPSQAKSVEAGSLAPTVMMLMTLGLIRLACFWLRWSPANSLLLLSWSFGFSGRLFDALYFALTGVSIWCAISSALSMRRIERLEEVAEESRKKQLAQYQAAVAAQQAAQLKAAAAAAQTTKSSSGAASSTVQQGNGKEVAASAVQSKAQPTSSKHGNDTGSDASNAPPTNKQ